MSQMPVKEEVHEHARLVLMMETPGTLTPFSDFVTEMRKEYFELGIMSIQRLYTAYRGWDEGLVRPWLSIETGEHL